MKKFQRKKKKENKDINISNIIDSEIKATSIRQGFSKEIQAYSQRFDKIDYKAIKKRLYELQHKVCDIYEDKTPLNELPMELQTLYQHFKKNKISLDSRLYVSSSAGM